MPLIKVYMKSRQDIDKKDIAHSLRDKLQTILKIKG
ncbi:hypothetical protein J2S02_002140 [Metabacillus niabensis]|uniref:Uncharacterized protein n=1 Tax=Metabacillus niabensis TaxID=324854 RepID=A0ABT9Z0M0_9BACI|nr:hypothetical protein [Metabacillus niabensis]